MSAIETLTRADAALAAQLDKVTDAVNGVGAHTAAARQRLALALSAARDRLAAELDAVGAAVGELAEGIDALAGCDLLALPEPEPDREADPATLGVAMPSPAPEALECSRCGRLSEQRLCGACRTMLAEDESISVAGDPNRVKDGLAWADKASERAAELVAATEAAPPSNGRPKKRRR